MHAHDYDYSKTKIINIQYLYLKKKQNKKGSILYILTFDFVKFCKSVNKNERKNEIVKKLIT
jgi:hypothetical protein